MAVPRGLRNRNTRVRRNIMDGVVASVILLQYRRSRAMGELHVVLGAGQVGPRVAQALVERGHRVRVVRRTSRPLALAGVEGMSADVGDAEAVARATDGATSVYHCANPLYFEWPKLLLPMTRGIVEGTRRSGACCRNRRRR